MKAKPAKKPLASKPWGPKAVKAKLVRIGNSRGVRLPKTIIEQASRSTGRQGQIALDHLRSIDKSRLVKRLGDLDTATGQRIAATLVEMFR